MTFGLDQTTYPNQKRSCKDSFLEEKFEPTKWQMRLFSKSHIFLTRSRVHVNMSISHLLQSRNDIIKMSGTNQQNEKIRYEQKSSNLAVPTTRKATVGGFREFQNDRQIYAWLLSSITYSFFVCIFVNSGGKKLKKYL